MIPRFEDAFEGVKSVSNYNMRTAVVSFGENSTHIRARWYSRTDFDDGAVMDGEAKAHFRLKKQGNKWLIWNMRTEGQ